MTPEEIRDRLIGSWRLLDVEHIDDDGEVGRPFGESPQGLLIYTPEGTMSATVMRRGRPNFAAADILAASDAERIAAFASASAFAGRYEIVGDEICHHLEIATYPNWTGTDQLRRFELTGTLLTLYPPRMRMEGKTRRAEVRWERLAPWRR